jgi:hypothetical protein
VPRDGRQRLVCAKKRRGDLAEAFATEILGRPGIFKAASSQDLYTLAPVENSNGGFGFRIGDLDQIERVEITEAQANRIATNVRTRREKTLFSVRVKDSEGSALRRLHESRTDISYGDDSWRLDHIIARIVLKTPGGRAPTISVTIKPPGTASFPRVRHKKLVMALLKLNALPKKVDWDQTRLAALSEQIRAGGEDPGQYVEVSFKVSERAYTAWPDRIRTAFEPARTVRTPSGRSSR